LETEVGLKIAGQQELKQHQGIGTGEIRLQCRRIKGFLFGLFAASVVPVATLLHCFRSEAPVVLEFDSVGWLVWVGMWYIGCGDGNKVGSCPLLNVSA